MPPPVDLSAWQRLGRLLADRRVQIGARYKNKNLFATEREINRRMLWQVESGERDTYRPDTIRAIEGAYMLVPGSLERTLAGGGLEPARDREPARLAAVPAPGTLPDDPTDEEVERLILAEEPFSRRDMLWKAWRLMGADRRTRLELLRVLLAPPPDVREVREEWRDTGCLTAP